MSCVNILFFAFIFIRDCISGHFVIKRNDLIVEYIKLNILFFTFIFCIYLYVLTILVPRFASLFGLIDIYFEFLVKNVHY